LFSFGTTKLEIAMNINIKDSTGDINSNDNTVDINSKEGTGDKKNFDEKENIRSRMKKRGQEITGEYISREKLKPIKTAAQRIARMICALSREEELFVISNGEKPSRRIDTKTLKEFSSVIKEVMGIICELNEITGADGEKNGVRIEFAGETEFCSE
jgi:hypothetical protein